jgi:hypothetical protein
MKLDKDSEIVSCQVHKYLGVIFDTSGTDDKGIRSKVIQGRKFVACLNGMLWSEDIRKERKLNIYNALINPLNAELNPICHLVALLRAHPIFHISRIKVKSSLLYGSETWRLTENNKKRVEDTEMDVLRRSSRISRKDRIRNVTIRQQI